jgi:hypothetical protein
MDKDPILESSQRQLLTPLPTPQIQEELSEGRKPGQLQTLSNLGGGRQY